MLVYTVEITVAATSAQAADRMLSWLEDDHLMDVVRAGAERAEAVVLDSVDTDSVDADSVDADATTIECRYYFASREAFAAYEAGPAEALRAEGRALFGADTGVQMRRSVGELRIDRTG